MTRIAYFLDRPQRVLAALATVLAAGGLTVASGADFTAQSANPANTFATGTLTVSNSSVGAAVLSAAGLRPGYPATVGTVDIANTGTLSGQFTLTRGTPDDSDAGHPLSARLELEVVDCGAFDGDTAPDCGDGDDAVVYDGTVADMGAAGHAVAGLGEFEGGERHRYRFATAVDPAAGNEYQGDSSSVEFTWHAA